MRAKVRSQLRVRTSQAPELDTSAILDEPTSAYETISGIKIIFGDLFCRSYLHQQLPRRILLLSHRPRLFLVPTKVHPVRLHLLNFACPESAADILIHPPILDFLPVHRPLEITLHSPSVEARSHSRPHSSLHSPVRTHAHFPLHSATSTNRPSFTSTSSPNPRPSLNRGGSSGMESIWESSNPVIASSEEEVGYDTDATGSLSMTASPVLLPSN